MLTPAYRYRTRAWGELSRLKDTEGKFPSHESIAPGNVTQWLVFKRRTSSDIVVIHLCIPNLTSGSPFAPSNHKPDISTNSSETRCDNLLHGLFQEGRSRQRKIPCIPTAMIQDIICCFAPCRATHMRHLQVAGPWYVGAFLTFHSEAPVRPNMQPLLGNRKPNFAVYWSHSCIGARAVTLIVQNNIAIPAAMLYDGVFIGFVVLFVYGSLPEERQFEHVRAVCQSELG